MFEEELNTGRLTGKRSRYCLRKEKAVVDGEEEEL